MSILGQYFLEELENPLIYRTVLLKNNKVFFPILGTPLQGRRGF